MTLERKNVILFNKTADSLKDFVDKFLKGQAHVVENIKEKVKEFND